MTKFFFGDLVGIKGSYLQGRVKTYNPENKTYKISNARWTREYPTDCLFLKKTNIQIVEEQAEREKQKRQAFERIDCFCGELKDLLVRYDLEIEFCSYDDSHEICFTIGNYSKRVCENRNLTSNDL